MSAATKIRVFFVHIIIIEIKQKDYALNSYLNTNKQKIILINILYQQV